MLAPDGRPIAFAKFPLFGSDSVLHGRTHLVPLVCDDPQHHIRQNRLTGARDGSAALRLSITTEKHRGKQRA